MTNPFLEVKNLSVNFPTNDGLVKANQGISFTVSRGETLAIVGESGSGKSVSTLAVMGLHNRKVAQITGQAILNLETGPVDVIAASEGEVRKLRGKQMAMIFQDPMSSLHPYYTIGDQLSEAWRLHNHGSKSDGMKRAAEMLDIVGIPGAAKRAREYPHQFSGGMRQRAMIAMALINNPALLIADEPTTALDVTVQSQILQLLRDLQRDFNTAIVLITHDLGVVAELSDRVNVMYAGRIVEQAGIDDVFYRPMMPYTMGLLESIPRVDKGQGSRLRAIPGQPPSLIVLPSGCSFEPRCHLKHQVTDGRCQAQLPDLVEVEAGHFGRCHLSSEALRLAHVEGVR
jgi:peptide/nickel transport system ATP-binding protein